MARFELSVEDDTSVWTTAELECIDEETARECAIQLVSALFVNLIDVSCDWNSCRVRVMTSEGQAILFSSAAAAAVVERDRLRLDGCFGANH